jgi:hypothetical protein
VLREHEVDGALPTSGQFLWYELVQRGVVSKAKAGDRGKRGDKAEVSDALMHLREQGLVPWSWIVDETRSLTAWKYGASVADSVSDAIAEARLDCWAGEPAPLLLCESRSLAGVLERMAGRYLCPIAATNGQAGGFLHTAVGPMLARQPGRRVLYVGDFDWQGLQIEANTRRVLEGYATVPWERLALTGEQVAEHDLGRLVIQKADRRYRPPQVYPAVETEALSQRVIVDIVRDRLDELVPEPLAGVLERERDQRQRAAELLANLVDEEEDGEG